MRKIINKYKQIRTHYFLLSILLCFSTLLISSFLFTKIGAKLIEREDKTIFINSNLESKWKVLHKQLIKKVSSNDKKKWVDDIWASLRLKSHADEDRITLLNWFDKTQRPFLREILPENKKVCGICIVTNDRRKMKNVNGVIILNGPLQKETTALYPKNMTNKDRSFKILPDISKRNLDQFWVFQVKESAIKGLNQPFLIPKEIDEIFNLTSSYRLDSDITHRFGDFESIIRTERFDEKTGKLLKTDKEYFIELMAEKDTSEHNTAWFVSDCNNTAGAQKRWKYGKSLMDADLKLYGEGKCFEKSSAHYFRKSKNIKTNDVFALRTMKFYLSFENAFHCNDYISEKFWRNALDYRLIPVVWGPNPADVTAISPPNSFIHAEGFSSPAELVGYLNYLDENDSAYLEYHQWRSWYPKNNIYEKSWSEKGMHHLSIIDRSYCELCRTIRDKRKHEVKQSYKSVMKFWHYDVNPECKKDVVFQKYQMEIDKNIIFY